MTTVSDIIAAKDSRTMYATGKEIGIEVIRAQAYTSDIEIGTTRNIPVSSSLIRKLLHEGEVEIAARCLKYEYFWTGLL